MLFGWLLGGFDCRMVGVLMLRWLGAFLFFFLLSRPSLFGVCNFQELVFVGQNRRCFAALRQ